VLVNEKHTMYINNNQPDRIFHMYINNNQPDRIFHKGTKKLCVKLTFSLSPTDFGEKYSAGNTDEAEQIIDTGLDTDEAEQIIDTGLDTDETEHFIDTGLDTVEAEHFIDTGLVGSGKQRL
jgi:hypothetical protein